MINQLKIYFAGSFQARLATESDPTGASPTDPYGVYGAAGRGWTFAYRETAFDRVIRLSRPVELRTALMDPWHDAGVTALEEDSGSGLRPVTQDVLLGKVLSLGSAKFDTASGGGAMTREALIDFRLTIGGNLFAANAVSPPRLDGVDGQDHSAWQADYTARKRTLLRGAGLDAVRARVLADYFYDTYASFFQARCASTPATLQGIRFGSQPASPHTMNVRVRPNILYRLDPPASTKYTWTFQAAFYRFDGDTLTGQVDGTIVATHV
jgi:hypothetical protein